MELLDLDDDAIIAILNVCDMESKLNLMATCKRFEFLIGNNFNLYKEFKLKLDNDKLKDPEALLKIRRNFCIVIYNVNGSISNEEFEVVLEVLQIVGEKLVALKLDYIWDITVNSFTQILQRVPNVMALGLGTSYIRFVDKCPITLTSPPIFPNLKLLALDNSFDHKVFNQIFSSVISLHNFQMDSYSPGNDDDDESGTGMDNDDHWKIVQQIIATNPRLKSLRLFNFKNIKIFDFPAETEIQLEKLELINFEIAEKSVVDNFARFIKIQKNVKELYIDSLASEHCYKEVLTHLLNLKSLEKLYLQFKPDILILDIIKKENPNLKTLEVSGKVDHRLFPFFPNMQTLKIRTDEFLLPEKFCASLNSLKSLKELFTRNFTDGIIQNICLKNLEKFEIDIFEYSDDDESVAAWNQFTKNNCRIKHLMLVGWSGGGNFLRHLECIMENLPNLKSLNLNLRFGSEEIETRAIEMIAKNCAELEYVELRLEKEVADKATVLFRNKSSTLKFKFNEHIDYDAWSAAFANAEFMMDFEELEP